MTKFAQRIAPLALLAVLAGAAGCGWLGIGESGSDVEAFDTPAQVLANEAEVYYRDGDYDKAADMFQQLKDRYPYSRYALLADLRVGDAYYKSERYDEAVLAYDDFIRLHPKNEAVPYAMYQTGMVYYDQMLTPDRDPTFSRKAMESFQRLIKRYPHSEWAAKAQPRLQEAVRRLAGHDMVVGNFYLNTGKYRAAASRFKRILTQYPDVGLYKEAMDKLKEAQDYLANLTPEELEERDQLKNAPLPGSDAPPGTTVPGQVGGIPGI